ncbi:hypothetical protein TUMEXPCC7403_18090 [Tumidithrix helvetica PCC 7403]|uniref:DUF1830 domain-containing protein n=1 Tax=Tumidithrix helvetica TaxID=3457545 RepID=UPI003C998B88
MVSTQHELYKKLIVNCRYRNSGESVQIIRVSRSSSTLNSGYLQHTIERTVMPNHQIDFQAPIDALLEVHEGIAMSSIHADSIPCVELRIANPEAIKQESVSKPTNSEIAWAA